MGIMAGSEGNAGGTLFSWVGTCGGSYPGYCEKNDIAVRFWEYGIGIAVILMVQIVAYVGDFYGIADVLVFLMCGFYFLFQKGPQLYLTAYVMVYAMSGCLLLLVQMVKRNISGMYLRRPVAYIPYIYVAFVLTNVVV